MIFYIRALRDVGILYGMILRELTDITVAKVVSSFQETYFRLIKLTIALEQTFDRLNEPITR